MRLAIRGRVDEQNPTAILMEDFLRGDKASQHFLLKCVGRDPIKIASATYDPKFLNVTWKNQPRGRKISLRGGYREPRNTLRGLRTATEIGDKRREPPSEIHLRNGLRDASG